MGNLAFTYSALGRHQDALVMKEKTLEFQRRVLPENHPDIRIACLILGISYAKVSDLHRAIPARISSDAAAVASPRRTGATARAPC
jgi:UPF0288 family protein (methanogenesis marker protein 3)